MLAIFIKIQRPGKGLIPRRLFNTLKELGRLFRDNSEQPFLPVAWKYVPIVVAEDVPVRKAFKEN